MHIPDGFVSDPVNAAMGVVAVVALAASVRGLRKESATKTFIAPVFAVLATFIFAAQMLNFPIGGGTSGHFLGAVMAAAVLGPWGACLALALVLGVQGVLFGDGGMLALGSNIVNMGVVGGILAYPVLRKMRSFLPDGAVGFYLAVGVTSWLSIVAASAACAIELAVSGTSALDVALPAMVGTHALIGFGEAAVSVVALAALFKGAPSVQPAWAKMSLSSSFPVNEKRLVAVGLALALVLAAFVSPFASGFPDGLEKVAEDKGFISAAVSDVTAPFADYQVAAVSSETLSTGLAGLVGSLLVFGVAFGSGRSVCASKRASF
ncbi:MAG: energy-coupling factor ABC transporter permease [Alphaproteobacteria bacterium]|nr:energy-coupling factor ABC transporter permease [Alphaproteobacteria bacterium]